MQFILEYAPLLLFFVAYQLSDIYTATGVAMTAAIVGLVYAKFVVRKVSVVQWISLGIIVVFGGATIALHDDRFIKIKPTVLYAVFAAILLIGKVFYRRDWIAKLFEDAQFQAPASSWTLFTWLWIGFFIAMAMLNMYVANQFSMDSWVRFKALWTPVISLVFAVLSFLACFYKSLIALGDDGNDQTPK